MPYGFDVSNVAIGRIFQIWKEFESRVSMQIYSPFWSVPISSSTDKIIYFIQTKSLQARRQMRVLWLIIGYQCCFYSDVYMLQCKFSKKGKPYMCPYTQNTKMLVCVQHVFAVDPIVISITIIRPQNHNTHMLLSCT